MKLIFSEHTWEGYLYWQRADKKTLRRINQLIQAIQREPFSGIGKPEPLRHGLSGYWSRRIDEEHRIVYKVADDSLLIAQLRYHY
ncbi:MAG: Txe/YoeB family addiction module toxin [Candidatus Thiodiazotropha endolucinida]|nr:Txe/YoeB family addiction module toxin [Candidatus Thiodiazotropha sp. (ex Lucina pensylvanica)]MCG8023262.1 Txe/YoeB family addiction module toxin [Candidatus Thiodiazotropha endolucinida]